MGKEGRGTDITECGLGGMATNNTDLRLWLVGDTLALLGLLNSLGRRSSCVEHVFVDLADEIVNNLREVGCAR